MEPSSHCPYLGLKQNRAIRFASPTPEHRCYVAGEPVAIPVDQATYCLSQGHVRCPLYTGSVQPSTQLALIETMPIIPPRAGFRVWLTTLSARDRSIYALMLGMLALIFVLVLILGVRALRDRTLGGYPPPLPTDAPIAVATAWSTNVSPTTAREETPTALPTAAPTAEPTLAPTAPNVLFPPTQQAILAPTTAPTVAATIPPSISTETVTLFFGDETGSLYVPVVRQIQVENGEVASAAVRELIRGSQSGLIPLLAPNTMLVSLAIENGTAIVNFDRRPTEQGDVRGYYAVVLTLTELPGVRQVQFQINTQNTGIADSGPVAQPILNPISSQAEQDSDMSMLLPLYFPLNDNAHDVRLVRVVPKTSDPARATISALLEGPGDYAYAVQQVIPEETQLRGLVLNPTTRIATVNVSQAFVAAANRQAAVRTIVQSLTALPDIRGVQLLVEGEPLADYWGETYRNGFGKPLINPE